MWATRSSMEDDDGYHNHSLILAVLVEIHEMRLKVTSSTMHKDDDDYESL